MMTDTDYVVAFADYLNKSLSKGQKAAQVMLEFLDRRTPVGIADLKIICKQIGIKSFQRAQWYKLGNPRAEGTKKYTKPKQYSHYFVAKLKDHTVFHKVGDHIELNPRLEGLAWEECKFFVMLRGSTLEAPFVASPAPSAPLPPRKSLNTAPVFRRATRPSDSHWVDLPSEMQPELPLVSQMVDIEAIDDGFLKRALESSSSSRPTKRHRVCEDDFDLAWPVFLGPAPFTQTE